MPHNSYVCNLQYLRTPMGAVKVVNVVFGVVSLILVAVSFVPVWTLEVFLGTVAACLTLSLVYITICILASASFLHSKTNRVVCFTYHMFAGIALVVAGIELIGWSEYDNKCKHDCPPSYSVGVAKTLTFINGTLYMIVAFLGLKDDDVLGSEAAEEDIPLLTSTSLLASVPGSHHYYNTHSNSNRRISFEEVRPYYYPCQNRPHPQSREYYNNSCSLQSANGSHFGINPNGRRARHAGVACSVPNTTFPADLHLIKE